MSNAPDLFRPQKLSGSLMFVGWIFNSLWFFNSLWWDWRCQRNPADCNIDGNHIESCWHRIWCAHICCKFAFRFKCTEPVSWPQNQDCRRNVWNTSRNHETISHRRLNVYVCVNHVNIMLMVHKFIAIADGHTVSNAPDLFRPPKLSGTGPG